MEKMALLAVIWIFCCRLQLGAYAGDFKLGYNTNASSNDYIFTTKAPKGNIGKSMSIPFRIRATDEDMNNLRVRALKPVIFSRSKAAGKVIIPLTIIRLRSWRLHLLPNMGKY